MGKNKQVKEKKFNRNVEISAPILDPEDIKAIHTPPKGQRVDIIHGGFKALLSDLNSQDSTDELLPLNDNHVPSYIGISCAVSGYSNYSPYGKRQQQATTLKTTSTPNRSRATSPVFTQKSSEHHVHHITIDKNSIQSPDEERKELTEKLTASATERRRSPSPCIPPTEDDRHHGAYVGARYCPLPPPSKVVNKHIPLLGIDDDQNQEDAIEEETNKVEQRIASLYGGDFVEDWRESMSHKAKKEIVGDENGAEQQTLKSPKDLVTLKPTPVPPPSAIENSQAEVDIATPDVKVLAGVEKSFLNKLLSDENPPRPSQPPQLAATTTKADTLTISPKQIKPKLVESQQSSQRPVNLSQSPPMSPDSGKSQSFDEEENLAVPESQVGEQEHIEYEIRAQSPLDNSSSPIKERNVEVYDEIVEQKLVSFSPEPLKSIQEDEEVIQVQRDEVEEVIQVQRDEVEEAQLHLDSKESATERPVSVASDSNDGRYYLNLLDKEKSFMIEQIRKAEAILKEKEAELDEDTIGRVRSAIGKANLLINKKCNQFKELCEANLNKDSNAEFATLNDDLAGFWDMLSIQVSDVQKSFETLWQPKVEDLKSDNLNADQQKLVGEVPQPHNEDEVTRKTSKGAKLSAQKDHERRERLKEHINQMKQSQAVKLSAENLLDDETVLSSNDNELIEKSKSANADQNSGSSQQLEDVELFREREKLDDVDSVSSIDSQQLQPSPPALSSEAELCGSPIIDLMETTTTTTTTTD